MTVFSALILLDDGLYVHVQGKCPLAAQYCSGDHGHAPDSLTLYVVIYLTCTPYMLP